MAIDLARSAERIERDIETLAGSDYTLSDEAIRLGRLLAELMPEEPEPMGLLALMLLTDARRPARQAPDGTMVRLADQDRSRWDGARIEEGHALVRSCLRRDQPGPFQIQAAIAAVHADAPTAADTGSGGVEAAGGAVYAGRRGTPNGRGTVSMDSGARFAAGVLVGGILALAGVALGARIGRRP